MTIYVDIDNTICVTINNDYANAKPIAHNIEKINRLYEEHFIVYYTARGSLSNTNYKELTERQLKDWHVKYDKLRTDKPFYDIMIDDKAYKIENLK